MIPMNIHHRESFFNVRLMRISAAVSLGIIAQRTMFEFNNESGFQLAGPGDGKHVMFACYPKLEGFEPGSSLDYKPLLAL